MAKRHESLTHFPETLISDVNENFNLQKRVITGLSQLLDLLKKTSVKTRSEEEYVFPFFPLDEIEWPSSIQQLLDRQTTDSISVTRVAENNDMENVTPLDDETVSIVASDFQGSLYFSYCPDDKPKAISGTYILHKDTFIPEDDDGKPIMPRQTEASVSIMEFNTWLMDVLDIQKTNRTSPDEVLQFQPDDTLAIRQKEIFMYETPGKRNVTYITEYIGNRVSESFTIEYETGTPGRTLTFTQDAANGFFTIIDRNLLEDAVQPLSPDEGDMRRLAEILEDECAALSRT